mmetsp:Transcript_34937/g.79239  ORF Transcript_34937/g.79239 Transcript_34937/m.79239 type:complete len:209 (+) Transcript_34937:170-796(+)
MSCPPKRLVQGQLVAQLVRPIGASTTPTTFDSADLVGSQGHVAALLSALPRMLVACFALLFTPYYKTIFTPCLLVRRRYCTGRHMARHAYRTSNLQGSLTAAAGRQARQISRPSRRSSTARPSRGLTSYLRLHPSSPLPLHVSGVSLRPTWASLPSSTRETTTLIGFPTCSLTIGASVSPTDTKSASRTAPKLSTASPARSPAAFAGE